MLDLTKLATQYTKQARAFARTSRESREARAACDRLTEQGDHCPATAAEEQVAYYEAAEASETLMLALSFQMGGEAWATRWASLERPAPAALEAMDVLESQGWAVEYCDGVIVAAIEIGPRRDGLLLNIIAVDTWIASSVYIDKAGNVGPEQDSLFSIKD